MIPADLKYTTGHEWIKIEGDTVTIGITDYAQSQLGDITYVELPPEGKEIKAKDSIAVVESVKAASDVYAPVNGTVAAINEDLEGAPENINNDPYEAGWICKLSGVAVAELESAMGAEDYEKFLENGAA
jgi:glycine cleavage system H protein